ncbi:Metalloenzyme, LuxS/M16 peptidase-like protein [Absidia repens]|uniref:Metalloenzyme, LuxS/M16 peptidase-like protein n=1 Tax=Absidia repens TaxID=90262 RepID=A0A1X2IB79_9FUNG|nr:Metalloenzyme, LuxS/M16 peptidase-like protein [Absidia repens]
MLVFSNDDWEPSQDTTHHVFNGPMETPANDERQYRLIRLTNQLQVLVISDSETDRASAALDVHVGNLSDPDNLQGLAHFCEHLLFMGTEKYPKENDYCSYLSEHSGYANAWTGSENTNYYFEVGHQWLEGALDRFAHFFIDPLFSDSCTEREIHAVDSEHKKNLQSDSWRVSQVEKTSTNPDHPWHKFGTGNLETLMETPKRLGLDVREELLRFHNDYYSANIMRLCVLGREPLDQLTQWVVEKFSNVPDKNIQVPTYPGHPLTENELLKQIFVKSVKHNHLLGITFPFPDQTSYFESQPVNYISHLIGHEGSGSILSYLKKKGWATYLTSGCSNGGRGFSFYHASMDLTEEGLEHYEDVVIALFQYIDMLKKMGVQRWIFDEVQSLAAIEFKYSEKQAPSHYTSWLVQCMQSNYPPHMTISGPNLVRTYNPQLIDEHLAMLNKDNFRLTLSSPVFPKGIKCSKVEQWYNSEYDILPISDDLKSTLANLSTNNEFALPSVNEFIPVKLDVNKQIVEEKQRKPNLIQETSTIRLWHKKDDTFWIPKTSVSVLFRNPLINATPRNTVISRLYMSMLVDSLNEYAYHAEVAGLSYYLATQTNGLILDISGYSDKLPLLMEKVVHRMKYLKFDAERFKVVKDKTSRSYRNFYLDAPYQHAAYHLTYAIREEMWKMDDLARELKDITLAEVQSTCGLFISHLHMEALVHTGNFTADDTIALFRQMENILQPRPLMASQFIGHSRTTLLPIGQSYVYQLPVHDPQELNSAIEFYCQVCAVTDVQLRTRLSLMAQIAQEPCFNQLRTTEQLGYVVMSGIRGHVGILGLRVIIQSERDTIYLENRVMAFLGTTLRQVLTNMTDTEWQAQVDALTTDKKEKFTTMGQEGNKYWTDIESGYYEFDDVDKDLAELAKVTKNDMIAFYDTYIAPSSDQFRKLSVHLQSQKKLDINILEPDHKTLPDGNIVIDDIVKFKHQMPLSPAAVPFFLFSRI